MSDVDTEPLDIKPDPITPKAQKPRPARNNRAWGILVGALLIFIAGIFAQPYAESGLISVGLLDEEVEETNMSDQVNRLENQITRLSSTVNQQAELITNLAESNRVLGDALDERQNPELPESFLLRLSALETDLNPLKAVELDGDTGAIDQLLDSVRSDITLLKSENAAMTSKLRALEAISASAGEQRSLTPTNTIQLAATKIYQQLDYGEDFNLSLKIIENQLATMSALDAATLGDAISVLRQNASGVATHNQLSRQFHQLIPAIYAVNIEGEEKSWWATFFTIRRNDQSAEGLDMSVRDIEIALLRRDLDEALSLVETMQVEHKTAINDWYSAVLKRLQVENALDKLLSISGNLQ